MSQKENNGRKTKDSQPGDPGRCSFPRSLEALISVDEIECTCAVKITVSAETLALPTQAAEPGHSARCCGFVHLTGYELEVSFRVKVGYGF